MSHAYPIYDASYRAELACVKSFLAGLDNCQTIGRNGLHRYNNQDHAALSGLLAARNVLEGQRRYDVWSIGSDADYFEEDTVAPAKAPWRGPDLTRFRRPGGSGHARRVSCGRSSCDGLGSPSPPGPQGRVGP